MAAVLALTLSYNNSDGSTLLQLDWSLVTPHLEYASPVWNPHMHKDIKLLENVEKFAIRMITKRWDSGYQELLDMVALPSLETRRLQSSLCMLYKIVHNLCYFPSHIITPRPNVSQRTDKRLLLHQPFARTNTFMYSFVPHSVKVWNSLPEQIVTAPMHPLKNSGLHSIYRSLVKCKFCFSPFHFFFFFCTLLLFCYRVHFVLTNAIDA